MSYNLSVCVFIRDTFKGAFCLFEGMVQLLPLCDEFVVMDLGSTDGTLELLQEIARANSKVHLIEESGFPETDAGVFATLANELVEWCKYDNILYYQADEIWHENLVNLMRHEFEQGNFDLKFWRVQLRENFQKIKWFPHFVHRVGQKGNFNFVGDGMNTDRYLEPKLCSTIDGGMFPKWGDEYYVFPEELPLNEMIMDVSLVGAFLENIPDRRRMHTPFWNEPITSMPSDEDGLSIDEWMVRERGNDNWKKKNTSFDIPGIMRWHLGTQYYNLRPWLLQALKDDVIVGEYEGSNEWR